MGRLVGQTKGVRHCRLGPLGQAQDRAAEDERGSRASAHNTEDSSGAPRPRSGPGTHLVQVSGCSERTGPCENVQSNSQEVRRGMLWPSCRGTPWHGHSPRAASCAPPHPKCCWFLGPLLGMGGASHGKGETPEARPRLTVTREPG